MVRKAIVLAAGFGTRLRPFTCVTPKPLMPVWGVPILERAVEALRSWGVDDIVCNSHALSDQVSCWAREYSSRCRAAGEDGFSLRVSHEPEILGTGGVLNPLRDWIAGEPFYLVNGDIVFENAPDPAQVPGFDRDDVIASALVCEDGPRTVEIEPLSHFITDFKSISPGAPGTATYCGIACIKPRILDFVEPSGFSSIIEAYSKAMMSGLFVKAHSGSGFLWADAGTIADYVELNDGGDTNAFAFFPQLAAAAAATGASPDSFRFMGARGSERVFFSCDKGVVIVYDDTTRTENSYYAAHARCLAASGISVPSLLADIPEMKTLVLEFAGEERRMSEEQYLAAVGELAAMNMLGSKPGLEGLEMSPPFDAETWRWERKLFERFFLSRFNGVEIPAEAAAELDIVAEKLRAEPPALVHRDFQSTNILWKGERPVLIDFQGMRIGPGVYDLASLVYDPYVEIPDALRDRLVERYAVLVSRPEAAHSVVFAAVQRLMQCLGAYGRLESVGQKQFAKYMIPALVNLSHAAEKAGLGHVARFAHDLLHRSGGCTCKDGGDCA